MSLGEYTGAGSGTTKLLLHLNGNNTDTSGNSNSSTDTAITYSQANGKFGQGAGFNGSSSIILITDNAALQGTGSHTIGLWVKFTALPASDANVWLIMKGYDDGITGGWGVGLNLFDTSGTAKFRSYCASSADAAYFAEGFTPSTGIWYSVMSVFNSSTSKIQLYVNGNFISETASANNIRYGNGSIIGAYTNGTPSSFINGAIDEILIENTAWSASKIKKYYTYAKGRFGIN